MFTYLFLLFFITFTCTHPRIYKQYLFSILSNTQTSNVTSSQQSQQLHPFLAKLPPAGTNTAVVYATQVEKGTSTATITSTAATLRKTEISDTEAPKSPPKWPLRPGVMVHVKTDTKENLHAARTQSPVNKAISQPNTDTSRLVTNKNTDTQENDLNKSTVSAPELQPKNPFRVSRCDSDSLNNTIKSSNSVKTTNTNNNNTSNTDELVKFSNSKLLERILMKLKLRRASSSVKEMVTTTTNITEDETDEDTGDGSTFKRRNDYRFRIQSKASWRGTWDTWAWFGSNKSTRSNKNLVDNNNHISGIECTEKGNNTSFYKHFKIHAYLECWRLKKSIFEFKSKFTA